MIPTTLITGQAPLPTASRELNAGDPVPRADAQMIEFYADLFVPEDFTVPDGLTAGQFRLAPLGPQHNESDYAAWTAIDCGLLSGAEQLEFGGAWVVGRYPGGCRGQLQRVAPVPADGGFFGDVE